MRTQYFKHLQNGAAIIESCLVFIPLLLIATLTLELIHSQNVRHIAQLALYEAARAGSVAGAHPEKINGAFSEAILPLFVPLGTHSTPALKREALDHTIKQETGLSLWHISTLNPDPSVFKDFTDTQLSKKLGRSALRNDYLAEQHQAHIRQGWPNGQGPISGKTIFEAHILHLKLSLLYRPRTPGMALILKKLGTHRTDRTAMAWRKGYLVAELHTEVMMQSHAQQWNNSKTPPTPRVASPGPARQDVLIRQEALPKGRLETRHEAAPQARQEKHQRSALQPSQKTSSDITADRATAAVVTMQENKLCEALLCCHSEH